LLDKKYVRKTGIDVEYTRFEIDDGFFRGLPYIGILKELA
jgi:hypoxanthine-guanine phosphoribosyltransferase